MRVAGVAKLACLLARSVSSGHPCHRRCRVRPVSGRRTASCPAGALPLSAGGYARLDRSWHRLGPRVEYAGASAASPRPGTPQGRPVHPCRADPLRWQLPRHPASRRAARRTGARDRVSHRAAHRRAPGTVPCFADDQPRRSTPATSLGNDLAGPAASTCHRAHPVLSRTLGNRILHR